MATKPPAAAPPANSHPLATYLAEMQAARDILMKEQSQQAERGEDNAISLGERFQARADALALTSEIAHLDDSRTAFLVGVFAGTFPPSQALVDATVQLSKDLAAEVVAANRPTVLLSIVTSYINGAAAVATGVLPAAPAAPTKGVT